MSTDTDRSAELVAQVENAIEKKQQLGITGGQTKISPSQLHELTLIDTTQHAGIVEYHPTELVLTARAGTRLSNISTLLKQHGQHLPFEPPEYDGGATLGGAIATGSAGPRRPWSGSARDHVLGCQIISSKGKLLRFGGQVMKNVAGYDVSRLMAGSHGCLGLITEVSLKVMPLPEASLTIQTELSRQEGLKAFMAWRKSGLPLTGSMHDGERLYLRVEGSENTVNATRQQIGGELADPSIWEKLREKSLPFFQGDETLWRLSAPMGTLFTDLPGPSLMDWAGAQWWVKTNSPVNTMQALAAHVGGHAEGYPANKQPVIRQSPDAAIMQLSQRLKQQLDPNQLFNPNVFFWGL